MDGILALYSSGTATSEEYGRLWTHFLTHPRPLEQSRFDAFFKTGPRPVWVPRQWDRTTTQLPRACLRDRHELDIHESIVFVNSTKFCISLVLHVVCHQCKIPVVVEWQFGKHATVRADCLAPLIEVYDANKNTWLACITSQIYWNVLAESHNKIPAIRFPDGYNFVEL